MKAFVKARRENLASAEVLEQLAAIAAAHGLANVVEAVRMHVPGGKFSRGTELWAAAARLRAWRPTAGAEDEEFAVNLENFVGRRT